MRVLILGGTKPARLLAGALVTDGYQVISSLAGVTTNAITPPGELRVGGFGGVDGLTHYLHDHHIDAVVDATHPFAAQMSVNAYHACERTATPLLRLDRPSWRTRADAEQWQWVAGHDEATHVARAALANHPAPTVFLTVGKKHSGDYVPYLADVAVVCRVASAVDFEVPSTWQLLIDKGPFDADHERALCDRYQITTMVTKDSGGELTSAKLDVAAERGIDVVMIARPHCPGEAVTEIAHVQRWLANLATPPHTLRSRP